MGHSTRDRRRIGFIVYPDIAALDFRLGAAGTAPAALSASEDRSAPRAVASHRGAHLCTSGTQSALRAGATASTSPRAGKTGANRLGIKLTAAAARSLGKITNFQAFAASLFGCRQEFRAGNGRCHMTRLLSAPGPDRRSEHLSCWTRLGALYQELVDRWQRDGRTATSARPAIR
jgi:hypothetical protein